MSDAESIIINSTSNGPTDMVYEPQWQYMVQLSYNETIFGLLTINVKKIESYRGRKGCLELEWRCR